MEGNILGLCLMVVFYCTTSIYLCHTHIYSPHDNMIHCNHFSIGNSGYYFQTTENLVKCKYLFLKYLHSRILSKQHMCRLYFE